ncbi:MAG: calcium/sodium antiporter [Spirochaetia bacterium]|nr:calcium/sodium antiporter [Spirochaetia bacterium]
MLTFSLFIAGFVFLIKGADILVEGASDIARRLRISDLVVGLTIVAFGTSAPELAVNIIASVEGNSGIAFGNIVGSNIANTLLILGAASFIYPIRVQKSTVYNEIPFSMLAALVLFFMANDIIIDNRSENILSRIDGFVMLSFFSIFMYYIYTLARKGKIGEEIKSSGNVYKSVAYIILGALGLYFGGDWIVTGAIEIARTFGLGEDIIGLTIVAIGTSLPELATSVVASLKKNSDIAIGNVVGSNIFNIFWVLGLSASIRPLPISKGNNPDILVVLFSAFLLFLFLYFMKQHTMKRWQGSVFLFGYVLYLYNLIFSR